MVQVESCCVLNCPSVHRSRPSKRSRKSLMMTATPEDSLASFSGPSNKQEPTGKDERVLRFHEIPSDMEIRARWLKNIARGPNWIPSDHSKICSLHFTEDDYKKGMKVIRLKPTAVPTIFPGYPACLQEAARKRKIRKPPTQRQPFPQKSKSPKFDTKTSTDENIEAPNAYLIPVETCSLQDPKPNSCTISTCPADTESAVPDLLQTEDSQLATDIISSQQSETPGSPLNRSPAFYRMVGEASRRRMMTLRADLRKAQRRVSYYKKHNQMLAAQVHTLKEELARVKPLVAQLEKVQCDARSRELTAVLLLDQLQAYGRQRMRNWDVLTLRTCQQWKRRFPKSYQFARVVLRLPSRQALKDPAIQQLSVGGGGEAVLCRMRYLLNDVEEHVTHVEMSIGTVQPTLPVSQDSNEVQQ